jgi:hypothetical protein
VRRPLLILSMASLACGTAQPAVGPGKEALVDGFPSKPWPGQRRPGKDGRCPGHGAPFVIVRGGGCWLAIVAEPAACERAHASGTSYLVPFEGHCYYPDFEFSPQREPTSSARR